MIKCQDCRRAIRKIDELVRVRSENESSGWSGCVHKTCLARRPAIGSQWMLNGTRAQVLAIDEYSNVTFECFDPTGRLRQFSQPMAGFIKDAVAI